MRIHPPIPQLLVLSRITLLKLQVVPRFANLSACMYIHLFGCADSKYMFMIQ